MRPAYSFLHNVRYIFHSACFGSKSAAFEITAKLIAHVPPPAVHHGVSAVGPLQLPSLVDVSKSRPIVSSDDIFVRHEYPKELPTGWPRI